MCENWHAFFGVIRNLKLASFKIRTTKEQSAYAIRTRHVTKKIAAKPKYFLFLQILLFGQLLKVFENVLFNIASEASYIYILSGQKFFKNAKKCQFWKPEACGQTVLPDRSFLIRQKLMGNAKIEELKCDILSHFHTLWYDYFVLINKCNGGDSQTEIMSGHLSPELSFSRKNIRWDKWLMWRKTSIFKVFPPWVINMKVKWGQHLFSSLEKAFGRQI